jgi:hypothetical protein
MLTLFSDDTIREGLPPGTFIRPREPTIDPVFPFGINT